MTHLKPDRRVTITARSAGPTAEDPALVAALIATGSRVHRTRALTVITSARRTARAPHGFSSHLARSDDEQDAASA